MRPVVRPARVALAAALLSALLRPGPAAACAVCFSASDESRQAFLGTTVFLSLLPLLLLGALGWWLRRRILRAEGTATRHPAATGAAPERKAS